MLASHSVASCITVNIEGFSVRVYPNGSCVTETGGAQMACHNVASMKDFLKRNKESISQMIDLFIDLRYV